MAAKTKRKTNFLHQKQTFSGGQVVLVALAFAMAGVYAVITTFASSASPNSVWLISSASERVENLRYGDSFKVGYSSKVADPWAFVECWANSTTVLGTPNQGTYAAGDVMWSGYRSLTGKTSDTYILNDRLQGLWIGGGGDCKLSLIRFNGSNYSGKKTVLATTNFTVNP